MNNFFTKISNSFANRLYLWTFSLVALYTCCDIFTYLRPKSKKAVVRNFDSSGALILPCAKLCLCSVLAAARDAFLATFQP